MIPFLIGWLRIYGERAGIFASEVGVALVALPTPSAAEACIVDRGFTQPGGFKASASRRSPTGKRRAFQSLYG